MSMHVIHNKSNEITSLWPVFFSSSTHIWMYALIFVVSSRRNKTNPQHGNKFIPVINATHVQAFKPKLSTHDQSWRTDQQMLDNICVRKSKHFQPHSLLCHSWCFVSAIRSFSCDIDMIISTVDEAASTNYLSDHIKEYHIARWLHQYSSTSQAIASSQHHPRGTRPFFGRPSLYRKRYTGLAY